MKLGTRKFGLQLVRELVTPCIKRRMKISSLQRHVLNKIRCYLGRVVDAEEEEEDVVAAVEAKGAKAVAISTRCKGRKRLRERAARRSVWKPTPIGVVTATTRKGE